MSNKNKGMDVVTKMSIIGALFLLVVIIGVLLFTGIGTNKGGNGQEDVDPAGPGIVDVEPDYVRGIALVKSVDVVNTKLMIVNVDTQEKVVLDIDGAVDIKDEYGTLMTLAQLKMGDMISTKYDNNTKRPEYVNITAEVWERKDVQNVIIDTENKTIQLANDKRDYTEDLVVTSNGQPFSLEELNSIDKISVKGYKNKVWSIDVQTGHGFITLRNHNKYVSGTLEIGKVTYDVDYETSVAVSVGVHSVIISKEGMTPFITQILVEEDQEVVVDVGNAQAEVGIISFTTQQEGVQLYIDDELYGDFSEPAKLEYGEYDLRVEKDKFLTWESKLIVNQAYMVVEIDLNQQPLYIRVDNPVDSELYINSNYIGIIPIEAPIDEGMHTLTLRRDGYHSKAYNIQIENTGDDYYFTFPDLIALPTEEKPEEENPESKETPAEDIYGE